MKTLNISDLLDGICPDELGLELDPSPVTAQRVMELMGEQTSTRTRKPIKRIFRTVLIAAALALALSVTAYAVYQARIQDYIIPEVSPAYTSTQEASSPEAEVTAAPARANISLVGYQGTPEYEAYVEWSNYLEETGLVDDSGWKELPITYPIYHAFSQEQADKLDEIMAKYGLTPHTDQATVYDIQQLYNALGVESFFLRPLDKEGGGYVYDDGTFKQEMLQLTLDDGSVMTFDIFVSAKGSFSMISSGLDMSFEEWSYTTASGQTVDLLQAAYDSDMLFETEGAYIYISVDGGREAEYDPAKDVSYVLDWEQYLANHNRVMEYLGMEDDLTEEELYAEWEMLRDEHIRIESENVPAPVSRQQLEALADSIDFATLASRYNGQKIDLTAKMDALKEAALYYEEVTLPALREANSVDWDDFIALLAEDLGCDLFLADLPEGYEHVYTSGAYLTGPELAPMAGTDESDWPTESFTCVEKLYVRDPESGGYTRNDDGTWDAPMDTDADRLILRYQRLYTDSTREISDNAALFAAMQDGSREGYVGITADNSVTWFDADRDLVITLEATALTGAELTALAEGVAAN